jgi:hypothetical protein
MLTAVYLRQGVVYVPTLGKTDGGPYRWIAPYSRFQVTDETTLRQVIEDRFRRGNPALDATSVTASIFPYAGTVPHVTSWSAFHRESRSWYLREHAGIYRMQGTRPGRRNSHEPDPDQLTIFAEPTDIATVCDRLIETLAAAAALELPLPPSEDDLPPLDDFDRERIEALQAEIDAEPWVRLPPGNRVDELEDLLEWIANATPEDAAVIEKEIRRLYYNHRDTSRGDALTRALRRALEATDLAERAAILRRFEPYTHAYTRWDQHILITLAEGWRRVRKNVRRL